MSGTDENHEGCWVWAAPEISYMEGDYWSQSEPNNMGEAEHCSAMYRVSNFKLADIYCKRKFPFLCKRRHGEFTQIAALTSTCP